MIEDNERVCIFSSGASFVTYVFLGNVYTVQLTHRGEVCVAGVSDFINSKVGANLPALDPVRGVCVCWCEAIIVHRLGANPFLRVCVYGLDGCSACSVTIFCEIKGRLVSSGVCVCARPC